MRCYIPSLAPGVDGSVLIEPDGNGAFLSYDHEQFGTSIPNPLEK